MRYDLRTIEFYEISSKKHTIAGDRMQIAEMAFSKMMPVSAVSPILPDRKIFATHDVPIHRIMNSDGSEIFIAIHPKLREILELPFRGECDSLKTQLATWKSAANNRQNILQTFENSSLWKRLVMAWKGSIA